MKATTTLRGLLVIAALTQTALSKSQEGSNQVVTNSCEGGKPVASFDAHPYEGVGPDQVVIVPHSEINFYGSNTIPEPGSQDYLYTFVSFRSGAVESYGALTQEWKPGQWKIAEVRPFSLYAVGEVNFNLFGREVRINKRISIIKKNEEPKQVCYEVNGEGKINQVFMRSGSKERP